MPINLATLDRPLTPSEYQTLYKNSIENPEIFWAEQAQNFLYWHQPWQKVLQGDFTKGTSRWFNDAKLNVCFNCVDRHLPRYAEKTAILWQGEDPDQSKYISYAELHLEICRFANVLKNLGVSKGDRVAIYLPMIPQAAIAMLACARIGAIHSVVFAGFSPQSLQNRINDAACKILITADAGQRGGKSIPLKKNADIAVQQCPSISNVIVVKHTHADVEWQAHDIWYHDAIAAAADECPIVTMDANDPLFILYTSGSTGKAKGIVHGSGGYLTYAAITHKTIFNYQPDEVFWCTADVGWITGHSYVVYGPLCNAGTTLMFEGVPNYPNPARCWEIIDQHKVTSFYTAPTAIRSLMREGDEWLQTTSRQSLKILGSVGEPINPEVWQWYFDSVGKGRCDIVDTWWQTETGGIMLSPILNVSKVKPGAACTPFFGVSPHILQEQDNALVITKPWPGILQTIYGDPERLMTTYFEAAPNNYFTGDGAKQDADGDYWITGRIDDVINVSGHRLGSAEIESALVEHPAIAEAAVIGIPHAVKGQGIYAYVTPKANITANEKLKQELIQQIRQTIGAIATPDTIHFAAALPKTRSGKIMRRILRKIACGETQELGDTSTLAEPNVIQQLIESTPHDNK